MPKMINKDLIDLIQSMDKAEKRFFKVHFGPNNGESNPIFVQLFDHIETGKNTIEEGNSLCELSSMALSNTTRHLQSVIMKSLRLQRRNKLNEIKLSEWVDHARILYDRGLYRQSLKILDRALKLALKSEEIVLQLEIIEFEKRIEARHITRSRKIKNKVESLIQRSQTMALNLNGQVEMSNFSLKIHGYYIKHGLARSSSDLKRLKTYFQTALPATSLFQLGPVEKAYFYQGNLWYYYIQSDTASVYKYGLKWMNIYKRNNQLLQHDPIPYFRALHYLINAAYYSGDLKRLQRYTKQLDRKIDGNAVNTPTAQMLHFVYKTNAKLNASLLKGDYKKALKEEDFIETKINEYQAFIDPHRVIIFYYKLAWFYFGIQEYNASLDYLNKIYQMKTSFLREDIACYVQLLQMVNHFALGNSRLVDSLMRSTKKIFNKAKLSGVWIENGFQIIQETIQKNSLPHEKIAILLKQNADIYSDHLQRHQGIYFDFPAWAEGLLSSQPIAVIKRKQYLDRRDR